jgi:hypothetical protein
MMFVPVGDPRDIDSPVVFIDRGPWVSSLSMGPQSCRYCKRVFIGSTVCYCDGVRTARRQREVEAATKTLETYGYRVIPPQPASLPDGP